MNIKKHLITITVIIICTTMIACGLEQMRLIIPEKGEIVLDQIPLSENIEGKRVDFIGLQIYYAERGYNNTSIYRYNGKSPLVTKRQNIFKHRPEDMSWDIITSVVESLDEEKRNRLTVLFNERNCTKLLYPPLLIWHGSAYRESFGDKQVPVIDNMSCINALPFRTPYREGVQGKMATGNSLNISGISNAEYFLVFAIRLLEIWPPENEQQNSTYKIALITVMYNRDGKKVYSAIYNESIEGDDSKENIYYNCIMQLFENQHKQINKDLSFLNTVAKAQYPTLEDMHVAAYNSTTKSMGDLYFPPKRY